MVIPQFQQTLVEDEYRPTYENTLPGITDIATPMAKFTPVTQASQMPVLTNVPLPERDMVEPMSSERARTTYLERQIQDMSSVRLPLNILHWKMNHMHPPIYQIGFGLFVRNGKRKENMNGNLLEWH